MRNTVSGASGYDTAIGFTTFKLREHIFPMIFLWGTVKGGEDKHKDLRAHTDTEEGIATGKVEDFEEGTPDYDGRTDAVGEVEEALSPFPCHDGAYFVFYLIFGHKAIGLKVS